MFYYYNNDFEKVNREHEFLLTLLRQISSQRGLQRKPGVGAGLSGRNPRGKKCTE